MKNIILLFIMLFLWSACEDDKEVQMFEGSDNFILEMSLNMDGTVYPLNISGGKVTLTVEAENGLDNAAASYRISELAAIEPDPKSVSDWSVERTFTVTAYDGKKRTYIYSPTVAETVPTGTVTLLTQEQVDAFEATGVVKIEGNLVIGSDNADAEPIENLDGLNGLTSVEGDVKILNSYAGADLSGLSALERVGSLYIGNLTSGFTSKELLTVELLSLKEVLGNLVVNAPFVKSVSLPAMEYAGGVLKISSGSLEKLDLSALKGQVQDLILEHVKGGTGSTLSELSLNALQECNNLSVQGFTAIESISAPRLAYASNLLFSATSGKLKTTRFDALETISGTLSLDGFPELEGLGGFPSLQSVAGSMLFSNLPAFKGIAAATSLAKLNNVTFTVCANIDELDFSGITFLGGQISLDKETLAHEPQLIGPDKFNGSIFLDPVNNKAVTAVHLKGFREISGDFYINRGNRIEHMVFPSIEYVGGQLVLRQCNYPNEIEFENLREIGNKLVIQSPAYVYNIRFPKLKKVANQLIIVGQCFNAITMEFPLLEEVGSDVDVLTKEQDSPGGQSWTDHLYLYTSSEADFNFPLLKKVNGSVFMQPAGEGKMISFPELEHISRGMTIKGAISYAKTLDFSKLSSMGGKIAINNVGCSDFSSFAAIIPHIEPNQWSVGGCTYSPKYEDMEAGRYKPQE